MLSDHNVLHMNINIQKPPRPTNTSHTEILKIKITLRNKTPRTTDSPK